MQTLRDTAYGPYGERNLLDLYLPERPAAAPLVVCIHGGGWRGGAKEAYTWMGESLVEHGFAAASITYRFWPEWPCPAAIDDAKRAVRWLRKHATEYGFDATRVGAIGGSAGAHLASHLGLIEAREGADPDLAEYPSRVQCVVDCYGPVDFVRMMRPDCASAPLVEGFMGKPFTPKTEADYRAASPCYLVPHIPPPFLLAHGKRDTGERPGDVPFDISIAFCERLQQAGGEATLMLLEGVGHGFSPDGSSEHTQRMWAAAVPFFRRHLGSEGPR